MTEHELLRKEFPDFDPATLPTIPESWEPTHWHNNMCPSWEVPALGLEVFVEFEDPAMRELPEEYPRFILSLVGEETIFESDDWAEILNAVGNFKKEEADEWVRAYHQKLMERKS